MGSVGHHKEEGNGRLPWFVRLSSCMLIRGPRGKELSSGRSACYTSCTSTGVAELPLPSLIFGSGSSGSVSTLA